MSATSSITIAEFEKRLRATRTPQDCSHTFLDMLAPFGVDTLAAGEVDLAVRERVVFYAIAWPDTWREFYLRTAVHEKDPILTCIPYYDAPFTWSDMRKDRRLSEAGSKTLQLATEHGWHEGLAVPIPRGGSRFGLVSLVARRGAFSAEEKSFLAVLSVYFLERVRSLAPIHGFAVPPMGLTEREIQCLGLIAKGYSDRELATKLGIAATTARGYFENAKDKLRAANRQEAVALAVSFGVIAS